MSTRILAGALLVAGLTLSGAAGAGAAVPEHGTYFRDAFNFDAPGWRDVVGRWTVRDGTLFSKGSSGTFNSVAHVNSYDDFAYEVRMNRVGNSDGSAPNCLIVRGNPRRLADDLWLPGYYFCYSNNGRALVVAFDAHGQRRELMDWTPVLEIGTGSGYRTVRVETIGRSFFFSVNGTPIWSGMDDLVRAGQVGAGFYVEPGKRGSLALDYANLGPVKTRSAHLTSSGR